MSKKKDKKPGSSVAVSKDKLVDLKLLTKVVHDGKEFFPFSESKKVEKFDEKSAEALVLSKSAVYDKKSKQEDADDVINQEDEDRRVKIPAEKHLETERA